MKYEVEIESRRVNIELERRDGRVLVRIGAKQYDVELISPEPGVYTFLAGDRVYEARVWGPDPNSQNVTIGGRSFSTRIIDRKHRRSAIEHRIEGRQDLVAPMPGKIVRVLLRAGEEVTAGQGVVVVEAMKMQNEIKSPKTGRVIEVRVIEGATVTANQILAVVE